MLATAASGSDTVWNSAFIDAAYSTRACSSTESDSPLSSPGFFSSPKRSAERVADWQLSTLNPAQMASTVKVSLGRHPLGARPALTLRAVAMATGVIGDAPGAAGRTGVDAPSQRRRPAAGDRAEHYAVCRQEVVCAPIRGAVGAHDVRHLVGGPLAPPAAVTADDAVGMPYPGATGVRRNRSRSDARLATRGGVACR